MGCLVAGLSDWDRMGVRLLESAGAGLPGRECSEYPPECEELLWVSTCGQRVTLRSLAVGASPPAEAPPMIASIIPRTTTAAPPL